MDNFRLHESIEGLYNWSSIEGAIRASTAETRCTLTFISAQMALHSRKEALDSLAPWAVIGNILDTDDYKDVFYKGACDIFPWNGTCPEDLTKELDTSNFLYKI